MKYVRNFVTNSNKDGTNTIEMDQFRKMVFGIFQIRIIIGYTIIYETNKMNPLLPKDSHRIEITAAKRNSL